MTNKQIRLAARLISAFIISRAVDKDEIDELTIAQFENRLSPEEVVAIENALVDQAEDLLHNDLRFDSIHKIIDFARSAAKP